MLLRERPRDRDAVVEPRREGVLRGKAIVRNDGNPAERSTYACCKGAIGLRRAEAVPASMGVDEGPARIGSGHGEPLCRNAADGHVLDLDVGGWRIHRDHRVEVRAHRLERSLGRPMPIQIPEDLLDLGAGHAESSALPTGYGQSPSARGLRVLRETEDVACWIGDEELLRAVRRLSDRHEHLRSLHGSHRFLQRRDV